MMTFFPSLHPSTRYLNTAIMVKVGYVILTNSMRSSHHRCCRGISLSSDRFWPFIRACALSPAQVSRFQIPVPTICESSSLTWTKFCLTLLRFQTMWTFNDLKYLVHLILLSQTCHEVLFSF